MELKKYQKQVLGDLDTYLKSLDESKGLVSAWSGYLNVLLMMIN